MELAVKSTGSATTVAARRLAKGLRVGGRKLKHVLHGRHLGGHLSFTRVFRNATLRKRLEAGAPRAQRICLLPLAFRHRAEALGAAVTSKSVFGCETAWLGDGHRRKLRSGLLRAL